MNSGDHSHSIESEKHSLKSSKFQKKDEELREEHTLMRKLQNRMLDQLNQDSKSSSMKHLIETLLTCCRDLRR